jgi:hypothetical protein
MIINPICYSFLDYNTTLRLIAKNTPIEKALIAFSSNQGLGAAGTRG